MKYIKICIVVLFINQNCLCQATSSEIICDIDFNENLSLRKFWPAHGKYYELGHGYAVNYSYVDDRFNKNLKLGDCIKDSLLLDSIVKISSKTLHFLPDYFLGPKVFYNPNCLFSIIIGNQEFNFSHNLREYDIEERNLFRLLVKDLYPNATKHYRGADLELTYIFLNQSTETFRYPTNDVSKLELGRHLTKDLNKIHIKIFNSYDDFIEMKLNIKTK